MNAKGKLLKGNTQDCTCSICESKYIDTKYQKMVIKQATVFILAMILLIVASCRLAHAGGCNNVLNRAIIKQRLNKNKIENEDAINAIIGEAESESYLGKLAIAYTIINRGTLRGVYGLHSKRVINHSYSASTYNEASKAWFWAIKHPSTGWRATGWGNTEDLREFKRQAWFKNCVITNHIGGHYFYREVK